MITSDARYDGKPLLRLLECYTLKAIDQLSETAEAQLEEMTPKLQSVYEVTGSWVEIVATIMDLPENLPTQLQEMWVRNTEIAQRSGVVLTPQKFAEMFVDQNLVQ